jgi:conjugative transfer signal peptidase TraF
MNKRFLLILSGVFSGTLLIGSGVAAAGYRVNVSASVPLGIYRVTPRAVAVGEYVQVCPPNKQPFIEAKDRGYIGPGKCPGGFGYLFKKVLAAKTDTVTMTDAGMTINGQAVPYSAPLKHDPTMRPLPVWRVANRQLEDHELILMTNVNPKSFDSRYFGPVGAEQVVSVVKPVLTWGEKP